MGLTASVDTRAWQQLVMEGRIHLGGIGHAAPLPTTTALVRLAAYHTSYNLYV